MTFTVAKHSGDVEGVLIDKTLVPKLQPSTADNGEALNFVTVRHVCFCVQS